MTADLVHLHRPAEPGRPTLLLLHGRGGAEGDLVPLADAIAPGLGVLAPRGPDAQQPAGFAWFLHRAIGVPVPESLDARLAQVGAWVADAAARYGTGPLVAVGFSNGGMMAGALLAARPDLVSSAALLSGAYPLPAPVLALGGVAGRRIHMAGGDADPFHTVDTLDAGEASYAASGALVEKHVTPGAGHGITASQVDALRDWLASG